MAPRLNRTSVGLKPGAERMRWPVDGGGPQSNQRGIETGDFDVPGEVWISPQSNQRGIETE